TPPTVSSVVKELIEQGIVNESNLGESRGGRKTTMLLINSSAFYVIDVDAGPETVECILADLSGKVMERTVNDIDHSITNENFLSIFKEGIINILEVSHLTHEEI